MHHKYKSPCRAFVYHATALLVSTHVVCERLSVKQQQARLGESLVQNILTAPTQAFEECGAQKIVRDVGRLGLSWSRVPHPQIPCPLPRLNENLARLRDFGFQLVQSPPSPRNVCVCACVCVCVWRLIAVSPADIISLVL